MDTNVISEKVLAYAFQGFWKELLPLLTPAFIKVFNEAYCDDLTKLNSNGFKLISIGENVSKHDLVAEFAYCIAEESIGNNALLAPSNTELVNRAHQKAIDFLKKYKPNFLGEILLNATEIDESFQISKNYHLFFEYLNVFEKEIEFRPKIKGAGFLRECVADLSVNNTLYEVKTTTGNISGRDLKQLLVYLGLQHATGERKWDLAGFFNPRRGLHYHFSVDHLIYRVSGGKSTMEVFDEMIRFLSTRGIELDTRF